MSHTEPATLAELVSALKIGTEIQLDHALELHATLCAEKYSQRLIDKAAKAVHRACSTLNEIDRYESGPVCMPSPEVDAAEQAVSE